MKIYRWYWSNEGIGWRRKNYFILKPIEGYRCWKLRRVGGKPGEQKIEREESFSREKECFRAGNKAIRASKKESKNGIGTST